MCNDATAREITIYSARDPALTVPILDIFTRQTGTPVNLVAFKSADEIAARLTTEGDRSPADMVLAADVAGLFNLVAQRLTQPTSFPSLETSVPANLRHPTGQWIGLSYRIRAFYVSKDRVTDLPTTYQDITDARYQGRVCIRSGSHPYNLGLFGAMLLKEGYGSTAFYLQGLKYNLARTATGGDRDVARDIANNVCDIGIANTYYMGLMLSGAGGADQKRWAEAVRVILPTFADGSGSHMNISGASITRYAPNRSEAIMLLEYLLSEAAQQQFADINFEYPVRPGVPVNPVLLSFGTPKLDTTTLSAVAGYAPRVRELVASVDFDRQITSPNGRAAAVR
jgi:iron(III) transport system substrate-binding protein